MIYLCSACGCHCYRNAAATQASAEDPEATAESTLLATAEGGPLSPGQKTKEQTGECTAGHAAQKTEQDRPGGY